jgi:hypothetical protein
MNGYSDRIKHAIAFSAKYYGAVAPAGAGMDYLELVALRRHVSWQAFGAWRHERQLRLVLFTTQASTGYLDHAYASNDILLFGREYWQRVIDFDALADEGVIAPEDTRLFTYVETAEVLGVSPATVRKWASRGKLTRYGSPGRAEYDIEELRAIAEKKK